MGEILISSCGTVGTSIKVSVFNDETVAGHVTPKSQTWNSGLKRVPVGHEYGPDLVPSTQLMKSVHVVSPVDGRSPVIPTPASTHSSAVVPPVPPRQDTLAPKSQLPVKQTY